MKAFSGIQKVIGITILAVGVGFFCLHYTKPNTHIKKAIKEKQQVLSEKITPIPTGAGDQNNPVTWSKYTYENDWQISYPPYWNVDLDQDGNGVTFVTSGFQQDDDDATPYGNGGEVVYSIFGQGDFTDMHFKNGDTFQSEDNTETMVVTNLRQMKVDGHKAVEFDYYPTNNTNFLRTRVAIQKGGKIYRFSVTYAEKSGKTFFNQMIQSLKFIS